jgi:uncharacterized Tic20 family protein
MNSADELQKLQQLHQSGALSDEEFATAKAKLLNSPSPSGPGAPTGPVDLEQQTRLWAMILHLSQLANFIAPSAGLIAPIVIWQIKKTELPGIDVHGKIVVNWIISALLYGIGCFILFFLLVGIPMLVALAITAIIFPIVGGIKANNGEAWKYPLSITFFK